MNRIIKILFATFVIFITMSSVSCKQKNEEEKVKITYLDTDDTILYETDIYKGEDAPEVIIVKEGYTFIGWDKELKNVQTDLTVKAMFTAKKFKVKFLIDGVTKKEETVEYGKSATAPEVEKEGYRFIGFDQDFSHVTSDLTINAKFEKLSYTIKFVVDGKIIKEEIVEYGESANAPTDFENDSFKFLGWDQDFSHVTSDLTINAKIEKLTANISYYVDGEKVNLSPSTFKIGTVSTLPKPEKEGYEFVGWFLSDISLTSYEQITEKNTNDIQLYARFIEVEKHNKLVLPETSMHFTGINKIPHSSGNGTYVYQPVLPDNAVEKSRVAYDWSTSDDSIASVSTFSSITAKSLGYCVLTATLKTDASVFINCVIKSTANGIEFATIEEANKLEICTVTFVDKDDNIIAVKKTVKGGNVILPVPPKYEGLAFAGWSSDNYNITSSVTIKATYKEGTNNYQGKSFAIIGDSISTYSNYIPKGFASFYPYPTADVNDVNMTWWMQVINKLGGTLFVNNSYSGTCVADQSTNATKNYSRLEYTKLQNEAPDVILIYMGSNDCYASSVSLNAFDLGYKEMIENLKKICPNSEIVLCSLATTSFYSATKQASCNEIIHKYGKEFNLKVVEMKDVDLSNYLVDSAHPKHEGMKKFAEGVIEGLLK